METYARPEAKAVFQFWKTLMMDCCIVSIESHKDCSICLAFAHLCLEKVCWAAGSFGDDVLEPTSPFWLARAIAEATAEKFKSDG